MASQATGLRAQRPFPGVPIGPARAISAATAVTLYLSTDGRGRSSEDLCDPPYRPTGGNTTRDLFALLKPQRSPRPPPGHWRDPAFDSQHPINTALVPPFSSDLCCGVNHVRDVTIDTSSSRRIRRCCVDRLNPPPESG